MAGKRRRGVGKGKKVEWGFVVSICEGTKRKGRRPLSRFPSLLRANIKASCRWVRTLAVTGNAKQPEREK